MTAAASADTAEIPRVRPLVSADVAEPTERKPTARRPTVEHQRRAVHHAPTVRRRGASVAHVAPIGRTAAAVDRAPVVDQTAVVAPAPVVATAPVVAPAPVVATAPVVAPAPVAVEPLVEPLLGGAARAGSPAVRDRRALHAARRQERRRCWLYAAVGLAVLAGALAATVVVLVTVAR